MALKALVTSMSACVLKHVYRSPTLVCQLHDVSDTSEDFTQYTHLQVFSSHFTQIYFSHPRMAKIREVMSIALNATLRFVRLVFLAILLPKGFGIGNTPLQTNFIHTNDRSAVEVQLIILCLANATRCFKAK